MDESIWVESNEFTNSLMEFEVGRRFKLERGFMRFVSFAHLLDFVVNSFQP